MTAADTKTLRTMCPMNCNPTYCGMLVEVEDGRGRQLRRPYDEESAR
jgi:hypothetical protein